MHLYNENVWIYINVSLKFGPMGQGQIDNKWALVRVTDWRRSGDKSLSEPMLTQSTDAYMRH